MILELIKHRKGFITFSYIISLIAIIFSDFLASSPMALLTSYGFVYMGGFVFSICYPMYRVLEYLDKESTRSKSFTNKEIKK